MAMKSRFLITAVTVAAIAYVFITHRSGADDTPQKNAHFSSPFVVVVTSAKGGAFLENPEIQILGGRSFIVGKAAAANEHWAALSGFTMWIPTDAVANMTEFNSLDEIKATAAAREASRSNSQNPQN
jgi:hypothetical protein